MEKVTYTNAKGDSIEIATNSGAYRLINLNIEPITDTPVISQGYRQNGYDYKSATAEMRDITPTFIVFGSGAYDLFEKRREVKRVMNPKFDQGVLRYKNDYMSAEITVKIDAEPFFATDKENFGYHSEVCSVSMTAYDPYWRDLSETQVELIGLTSPFLITDPIYFEESTPFFMGEVGAATQIIHNAGDVPAPLKIEWVGAATNPKITLKDTGEYILLDKVLESHEKLIITTAYGDKNVYIQNLNTGEIVKDFSIVNTASDFFSLPVGNSTVSLSADAGAGSAAVTLMYKNLFIGV